ncbi:hypothetical protein NEMIN01_0528 [Nematocida minor]|uniref:uncharacterized protein n=1 Tax=Nematocida minor TaxID=1912983 RepID=UPI00221FED8A|nr:uncharacterized protein NEMIN01_0528 [Nematocida minor]KAI5189465.1 hypothetical protein NEMIN01_0528 [Nematocida minor]
MKYNKKVYLSLLAVSGISAMFSPMCTPSLNMASINPCATTGGGSMFPDMSMGGMGSMDALNINCHISPSTGGSMPGMTPALSGMATSSLCVPLIQQPSTIIQQPSTLMQQPTSILPGLDLFGFGGNSFQQAPQQQANGVQLACNMIGMPDKQIGSSGSWGNDCYSKVGSIFMNGMLGGGSKLNDVCCTISGSSGFGNKMLR